jgi:photosystem II stability/assembly factor-like uncharacterized protein
MSFRCRVPPLLIVSLLWVSFPLAGGADEPSPVPQFLKQLRPRSIGPANMSGRIPALAVYEKEPRIMYVASATGGLWKTTNNGTTWKPVFEREATVSLGDVAVAAGNPDIVWVGTGEANARNSVSWGDGVYKSTDGGRTWKNMGLKETRHIGRIVLHPTNPDIVYVAALGNLWGPNKERGIFKTGDGGQTWECVKFIDENTGFVDLAMDPRDPNVLYGAAYRVRRDAFAGGNPAVQTGPGAGLYQTVDGGKTWDQLTAGLPPGPFGRCGINIFRKDPSVVYAVVQTDKTLVTVKGQPANKKTDLAAGGIFRSDDRGKTWRHVNSLCPRPFYYGQIRVDPSDDNTVYVLGVSLHMSRNGGRTFMDGAAKGTHADYHALWIDPRDSQHLVLGCDGGLNFSYDRATTWERLLNLPVGQFYAICLDRRKPYRVYGGLQDNGSWGGPSATRNAAGISVADWFKVLGYDGYYCQVDGEDDNTVYAEGQYGMLRRINVSTGNTVDIKPRLGDNDVETNILPAPQTIRALRFNWSSPILLSPHDAKTVYFASQFLFRSTDRGERWTRLSPDLTRGKPGLSPYNGHTITTIAESPRRKGLLYVGTDDGRVHVSTNGGKDWQDVSERVPNLPEERWITRLEASAHDDATVYLSASRHRNDDAGAYVFKSSDYGQNWRSLAENLPSQGPVHVVREDPRNSDLLYAGTEFGLFVSLDGGAVWHKQAHLPTVPVHDLAIHPRERELVIATHGRGIYVMDAAPLQEMTPRALGADAYLFEMKPAAAFRKRTQQALGTRTYYGENPAYGASIYYYFAQALRHPPLLTVTDKDGAKVAEAKGFSERGLHKLNWRLNVKGTKADVYNPVAAGTYTVTLQAGQKKLSRTLNVEAEE